MDFYYIFGVWILNIFFLQDNSSMNIRTGWKNYFIYWLTMKEKKNQRNNIFFSLNLSMFLTLNWGWFLWTLLPIGEFDEETEFILGNHFAQYNIYWNFILFFFCFISNKIVTRGRCIGIIIHLIYSILMEILCTYIHPYVY